MCRKNYYINQFLDSEIILIVSSYTILMYIRVWVPLAFSFRIFCLSSVVTSNSRLHILKLLKNLLQRNRTYNMLQYNTTFCQKRGECLYRAHMKFCDSTQHFSLTKKWKKFIIKIAVSPWLEQPKILYFFRWTWVQNYCFDDEISMKNWSYTAGSVSSVRWFNFYGIINVSKNLRDHINFRKACVDELKTSTQMK